MSRHPLPPALTLILPLLALALFLLAGPNARANQADSTIDLIAIDPVPTGNTATSLGTIDACVQTAVGSNLTVDLIVDSVPADRAMIAFDVHVRYDAKVVEATAVDYTQLLGAKGDFQPLDALSDPLPDSDGDLLISIIDLASNTPGQVNEETGAGVLARITLRAKAAGTTSVGPAYELDVNYPVVFDFNANVIGVNKVSAATIAVGSSCPAGAQPGITPLPDIEELITPTPVDPLATPGAHGDDEPPPGDDEPTDSEPSDGAGGNGGADNSGDLSTPSDQVDAGGSESSDNDSDGSDGIPVALIVVLSAVGVGAAGGGGWAFYRWRQGRGTIPPADEG